MRITLKKEKVNKVDKTIDKVIKVEYNVNIEDKKGGKQNASNQRKRLKSSDPGKRELKGIMTGYQLAKQIPA